MLELLLTTLVVIGLALFVESFRKAYNEMLEETEGVSSLYEYEERRRSNL